MVFGVWGVNFRPVGKHGYQRFLRAYKDTRHRVPTLKMGFGVQIWYLGKCRYNAVSCAYKGHRHHDPQLK